MTVSLINRAAANELWLELYFRKGRRWLPVLTNSMEPLIRPGDKVLVSKIEPAEIRRGDIIVFRRGDDLIVHRVLKKWQTADGLRFGEKGDRGYTYRMIDAGNMVGLVTMVKRSRTTIDISSPLTRLINLVVSTWLFWTSIGINSIKSSVDNRIGNIISRVLFLSSRVLVRLCFLIWYPSGIYAGQGETEREKKVQAFK
jgi:signal peptidase I